MRALAIKVRSSISRTKRHFDALNARIEEQTQAALRAIERTLVKEVLDNRNWNEAARYKGGPQEGEKYDLRFSGQILNIIGAQHYNYIVRHSRGFSVGVANRTILDKATSIKEGNRPRVPYWKIAVYGRAEIPGWQFVYKPGNVWAINPKKVKGFSRPGDKIARQEPTLMFENGYLVARRKFRRLVNSYLDFAIHSRRTGGAM